MLAEAYNVGEVLNQQHCNLSYVASIVAMYYYELLIAFTAGLIKLPTVYAGVPSIQSLGSVTVLSDNDLAGMSPT